MGTDKGFLDFGGKPMVSYAVEALARHCADVTILGSDPKYVDLNYAILPDLQPEMGPLGGIHTALLHMACQTAAFTTCDSPFVSEALMGYLISRLGSAQAAVPIFHERAFPLIAVYTKSCLPTITDCINNEKLSVRQMAEAIDTHWVDIHEGLNFFCEHLFMNINTSADLQAAKIHLGKNPQA